MNLREVTIVIPEDRLAELYALVGQWLQASSATQAPGQEPQEATDAPARQRARQGGSRYDTIATLLEDQGDEVTVTFEQVEEAIGGELPASARKHRPWWANTDRNSQARAWAAAGYAVRSIDFDEETVTFARA